MTDTTVLPIRTGHQDIRQETEMKHTDAGYDPFSQSVLADEACDEQAVLLHVRGLGTVLSTDPRADRFREDMRRTPEKFMRKLKKLAERGRA